MAGPGQRARTFGRSTDLNRRPAVGQDQANQVRQVCVVLDDMRKLGHEASLDPRTCVNTYSGADSQGRFNNMLFKVLQLTLVVLKPRQYS